MNPQPDPKVSALIRRGLVIPASPLALDSNRRFDERRQRILMRYYLDAGAGGMAVGMHFTQFEIRRPGIDLFRPVLSICADEVRSWSSRLKKRVPLVAGINGRTPDALRQVVVARELGYDYAIVSLSDFRGALDEEMVHHIAEIGKILPVFGFYLLTGVGGIHLSNRFWRLLLDLECLHGIKIAPFNRYGTIDVLRAVAESGRAEEVVLYTGNDDSIIYDLVTPFTFKTSKGPVTVRIRGGLLGQWACWTKRAVELLDQVHRWADSGKPLPIEWLRRSVEITDANAAIFDAAHQYAGSIPGVNEILRGQGLLANILTLKPDEVLAPGQLREIDRVCKAYPHLTDDDFVRKNLDKWKKF